MKMLTPETLARLMNAQLADAIAEAIADNPAALERVRAAYVRHFDDVLGTLPYDTVMTLSGHALVSAESRDGMVEFLTRGNLRRAVQLASPEVRELGREALEVAFEAALTAKALH